VNTEATVTAATIRPVLGAVWAAGAGAAAAAAVYLRDTEEDVLRTTLASILYVEVRNTVATKNAEGDAPPEREEKAEREGKNVRPPNSSFCRLASPPLSLEPPVRPSVERPKCV